MADFDMLWDYSEPAVTERRFRELLPEAEAAGDPGYHAELLTQIARTLGLQGRFAEAHAMLDQVESMLTYSLTVARIRYLLERGRAFRSGKQVDQAIPLFQQAWELGQAAGEDDYAVDAAHMLGIALPTMEEQLAWNHRALELAEQSPKARRWLGSLYNNMGWTYADAGQYEQALDLFERGVQFREKQGQAGPLRIARWSAGKMLRLLGRADEALSVQQELYELPEPDGFVVEELAECLLALGRGAEARPLFARAYELLAQISWLSESEPERLQRLQSLGAG